MKWKLMESNEINYKIRCLTKDGVEVGGQRERETEIFFSTVRVMSFMTGKKQDICALKKKREKTKQEKSQAVA